MSRSRGRARGVGGVGRLRWVALRDWQLWTRPAPAIALVLLIDISAVLVMVFSLRSTATGTEFAGRQPLYFTILLGACVLYT